MKRYFFAGLIILLPFALTVIIVAFFINLLTAPFESFVESTLAYYDILDRPFLFLSGEQVLIISSKVLILAVLFGFVLAIGFLAQMVLLNTFIGVGEYIIHRIPLINVIYKSAKEIVNTVFNIKKNAFSQVAIVPFPHSETYSLALVSSEQSTDSFNQSISIFIPTTPNPTIGFMLMIKREDLIFIDMKVEDAIKCIVSCGIMFPEFQTINE